MTKIAFQFDKTKAVEAILYLVPRVSNADIYGICKLLYLVDKTSLEKYGRFVFGETYVAMEEGATPSGVYDILNGIAQTPNSKMRIDGYSIVALREPNIDCLSESDVECLNEIIGIYGDKPNWFRAKDAHDEAWRESWNKRGNKKSIEMPIENIAKLLADSDNLIDFLSNRNSD